MDSIVQVFSGPSFGTSKFFKSSEQVMEFTDFAQNYPSSDSDSDSDCNPDSNTHSLNASYDQRDRIKREEKNIPKRNDTASNQEQRSVHAASGDAELNITPPSNSICKKQQLIPSSPPPSSMSSPLHPPLPLHPLNKELNNICNGSSASVPVLKRKRLPSPELSPPKKFPCSIPPSLYLPSSKTISNKPHFYFLPPQLLSRKPNISTEDLTSYGYKRPPPPPANKER